MTAADDSQKEMKRSSKETEWEMAESILHFQNGVRAVGPMIEVVEASRLHDAEQMFKLKQDDWIMACKEIDAKDAEIRKLKTLLLTMITIVPDSHKE